MMNISKSFEHQYPNIARWVSEYGWIEIGQDDLSPFFVRALGEGGMVWQGITKYVSLDVAFDALERGIGEWLAENM